MKTPLFIRRLKRLAKTGSLKSRELIDYRSFINSHEADCNQPLFNLAVDFELAWSRARRQDGLISVRESVSRGRKAKDAILIILDLAERYNIPMTFAVVGHLALDNCREHGKPPAFRPYWLREDWFDIDLKEQLLDKELYFAANIIQNIIQSHLKHEIASHSFSHVNLGDDATTEEVARYEVGESARALKKFETNLETFIFPKNKPASFEYLMDSGFKIYRSDKNIKIQKDQFGLWQFPLGLWISPTAQSSREIISLLDLAVENKSLVNLWFHGYEFNNSKETESFLKPIFKAVDQRRQVGLEIKTMRDIIHNYV